MGFNLPSKNCTAHTDKLIRYLDVVRELSCFSLVNVLKLCRLSPIMAMTHFDRAANSLGL